MTLLAAFYNVALIVFIALHLAVGGAVRKLEETVNSNNKKIRSEIRYII